MVNTPTLHRTIRCLPAAEAWGPVYLPWDHSKAICNLRGRWAQLAFNRVQSS